MGYDIAHKVDEIKSITDINDESMGMLLTYCILSAPKDKTLSLIIGQNLRENSHAVKEFKKRHIEHIRYTLLDFNPDVGSKDVNYAKKQLNTLNFLETRDENTIEGFLDKIILTQIGPTQILEKNESDLFKQIFYSIFKGSKQYSYEAKVNNAEGTKWCLFKEYNRINTALRKIYSENK